MVTAALMVADNRGVPLYIAVLAVSGVSRFLLSSLSVALPHVTPPRQAGRGQRGRPTRSAASMSALGGIVALGLNAVTGDTERGAAVTMLVGGGCYVAGSLVATIMPKDLLGPSAGAPARRPARRRPRRGGVGAGRRRALRPGRRGPRAALGATSAYSFLFGPLFLMTILLYRNYFYPAAGDGRGEPCRDARRGLGASATSAPR